MAFSKEEAPKLLAELVRNGYIIKEYTILKNPELKVKFKSMLTKEWMAVPRLDNEGKMLDLREMNLRDMAAQLISFGEATFNSPEAAYEALKNQSYFITSKLADKLTEFNNDIIELLKDDEVKKN